MRTYPVSKEDFEELEQLNAQDWQIKCLKKNPNYICWGNHEDYMSNDNGSWNLRVFEDRIKEGLWTLDDLNEVVNFYFELIRKNKQCDHCEGTGYNEQTKKLSEDWYSFGNEEWILLPNGRRYNNKAWQYHLTEIEAEALVKAGRLNELMKINCYYEEDQNKWHGWINGVNKEIDKPIYPTPEQVNEWAKIGFGHDGINQYICLKARAKYLNIWGNCEYCNGNRIIYTEEKARLGLQLWVLHPRKGCSRGVYINNIKQNELPEVIIYLKEAAKRNADRFSKL